VTDVDLSAAGSTLAAVSVASESGDRSFERTRAHVVGVYDHDDDLAGAVVSFLAEALEAGGTAIAIATPRHRAAFDAALDARGYSRTELQRAGRYQALDARELLSSLLRNGRVDARAFARASRALFVPAARSGGPVRVFGEMVALLWDDGDVAGALALESWWNALADRHAFALFCAYSRSSLDVPGDLTAAKHMCDEHSAVVALPSRLAEYDGAHDEVSRVFVAAPSAAYDVRAFVRSVMDAWGERGLDGEAEIVASELASNAVRHARTPFRVSLMRRGAAIRIAVRDASFDPPEHHTWDHSASGGRGVRLVAALSCAWGTDEEVDGKTVWAELARAS
jgi:anti-sigma regulatory factor (Ser/Thr protein kinase)